MKEGNFVKNIMLAASKAGARLWRQNTGRGWIGESVKKSDGSVIIYNARVFHAGFEGLPDTGGLVPVVVTPDMVGKTVGIYLTIEAKTDGGIVSDAQANFIRVVRSLGGRAGVARSDDDVAAIMRGEIRD